MENAQCVPHWSSCKKIRVDRPDWWTVRGWSSRSPTINNVHLAFQIEFRIDFQVLIRLSVKDISIWNCPLKLSIERTSRPIVDYPLPIAGFSKFENFPLLLCSRSALRRTFKSHSQNKFWKNSQWEWRNVPRPSNRLNCSLSNMLDNWAVDDRTDSRSTDHRSNDSNPKFRI